MTFRGETLVTELDGTAKRPDHAAMHALLDCPLAAARTGVSSLSEFEPRERAESMQQARKDVVRTEREVATAMPTLFSEVELYTGAIKGRADAVRDVVIIKMAGHKPGVLLFAVAAAPPRLAYLGIEWQ